jgi:arylsulfatase A-like enzyme/Flp pilus assembly protein TadD
LHLIVSLAVSMAVSMAASCSPKAPRREAGLSLLLVSVDTLRADALGAYGNPRAHTPWMDRLAAAGLRFEAAHAHNVLTLPSHANLLSGRHPFEHGVRDNQGFRFPNGLETLATLLRYRGYRTGAFVSAFPLDSRFGLARGFDVYEDSFAEAARPLFLEQERRGEATVALARTWLAEGGDRPFFCWVHVYEPHYPYQPPEPFARRTAGDAYAGEVAAADAALGPLLEPFLNAGQAGRTLVVLTSDHGESLGEHGEATHGIFAYEAALRVPLILHAPRLFAPGVVSTPAGHVDVLPTVLDALAVPVPAGLPGRSQLPFAAGEAGAATTTYFEALSGQLNRGWAPLRGVIRGRTKYIDLPLPELFDLASDPREERNLAPSRSQELEEMRALLAPFRSADRGLEPRPETAEVMDRLRGLGYLGGSAPVRDHYTEADDPKRLIALDALLHEATGHYLRGDLEAALARCRELVERRPGMALSLLYLAQLEREKGNLQGAVRALERAAALNPADPVSLSLLGAYLTQAGRAREAATLLEPGARRSSPDIEVLGAYALALAKLGRGSESLAALARARETDPSNARILVTEGTVHMMANDRARAREAFRQALALNPSLALAESSLAFMAAEDGRVGEAIDHWRKAISLDPSECEKLLVLGVLLGRRGGMAAARPYLELFVALAAGERYARDVERVRRGLAADPGPRSSGPR